MSRMTKYKVELVRESAKVYNISKTIESSSSAPAIIRELYDIASWHNEKIGLLCLDSQHNVIGVHVVSEGTINEAPVYVREIATRALLNNAVSVIMFHNHPGGSVKASQQDIILTEKVKEGLDTLNIKLLDHFILNEYNYKSLAEDGYL